MNAIEKKLSEMNGVTDALYAQEVSRLIRSRYSQSAVEAIINNYLSDPDNEKHTAEFLELQSFRAECKAMAKAEMEAG